MIFYKNDDFTFKYEKNVNLNLITDILNKVFKILIN